MSRLDPENLILASPLPSGLGGDVVSTWDIDAEIVAGLPVIARTNQFGVQFVAHELAVGVGLGVVDPSTTHLVVETLVPNSVGPPADTGSTLNEESRAAWENQLSGRS